MEGFRLVIELGGVWGLLWIAGSASRGADALEDIRSYLSRRP